MKQAGVLGTTSKESLAYIIKSLQVQYSSKTLLSTHWSALEIQVREIKGESGFPRKAVPAEELVP